MVCRAFPLLRTMQPKYCSCITPLISYTEFLVFTEGFRRSSRFEEVYALSLIISLMWVILHGSGFRNTSTEMEPGCLCSTYYIHNTASQFYNYYPIQDWLSYPFRSCIHCIIILLLCYCYIYYRDSLAPCKYSWSVIQYHSHQIEWGYTSSVYII